MFFTDDPYAKKFIHLLIIEQYKNNEASRLFREWFIGGPIDFQTALFRQMMKEGFFRMADPYAAAVQFYGPMLLLMLIYDPQPKSTAKHWSCFTGTLRCLPHTIIFHTRKINEPEQNIWTMEYPNW
jgi:hypothetical protein